MKNFRAVPYDAIYLYHMTKISDSSSDCVVRALQEGGTWGLRCQQETTSAVWVQRSRKHPRSQSMRTLPSYLNVHNVIETTFLWYLVPQTPNIRCTHSTSFTYILADHKCHHLLLWECISAGLSLFHSFFWTGLGSGDGPASKRGIWFVTRRNVDTAHDNAPLEATILGNYWKQNSGISIFLKTSWIQPAFMSLQCWLLFLQKSSWHQAPAGKTPTSLVCPTSLVTSWIWQLEAAQSPGVVTQQINMCWTTL